VVSGGDVAAALVPFRKRWETQLHRGEGYEVLSAERESIAVPGHGFPRVLRRSRVGERWCLGSQVLLKSLKLGVYSCPLALLS